MVENIDLSARAINTIRFLSADAVQTAKSGHPGLPMGAAAMAYTLWTRHLHFNPKNPKWANRDRFILSGGHGSMLLYSLLFLNGYDVSLEDLKRFRQWQSKTPGHPEYGVTPGVEVTTGPLGQGFVNGVGMAIVEAHLAALFNQPGHKLIDHYIYAIVTDGDLMEGITSEAASLAGHLGLGKIIYLYDDNHISIDGDTKIAFTEDRMARFAAYNWHIQSVADGNDVEAIDMAIQKAKEIPVPRLLLSGPRSVLGCLPARAPRKLMASPRVTKSWMALSRNWVGRSSHVSLCPRMSWRSSGRQSRAAQKLKRHGISCSIITSGNSRSWLQCSLTV